MNNRVVRAMYRAFKNRGFSTLRFNFRGVGRSQGHYDNGQGELSDAASALDWLQLHNSSAAGCWVGGFSFGAWIGMQLLMRRPEISHFVSVAPPASTSDFSFLAPLPSPGLIVHGGDDEVVPEAVVAKLAHKLSTQRTIKVAYHVITGANHSFDNRHEDLHTTIDSYIDNQAVDRPLIAALA